MSGEPLCVRCGRPTPDGAACSSCMERARRLLAGDPRDDSRPGITDVVPAARAVAYGLTRTGSGGGGTGPGIPLDPDAVERLHGVGNTLTTLARDIGEQRGIDVPDARGSDPIVVAAHFLATQLEWLRHAWDGPEPFATRALAEIDACHRTVLGIARGPLARRYLGPCGAPLVEIPPGVAEAQGVHPPNAADGLAPCDGEVYARSGADTGYCQACGTGYVVKARREWLDGLVKERNYRAAHIADAYDISADTIRSWASDHNGTRPVRLFAKGRDSDGYPLYNVADVLELDRQAKERKAEREARKARRTGDAA